MQAPFQKLRPNVAHKSGLRLILGSFLLAGNLILALSFLWASSIYVEAAHATAHKHVSAHARQTFERANIAPASSIDRHKESRSQSGKAQSRPDTQRSEKNPQSREIHLSSGVKFDPTIQAEATTTISFVVQQAAGTTPTPTPTPTPLPDVSISQTVSSTNNVVIGQTLTYTLKTVSTSSAGPIPSQFVKVKDVLPTGLTNVTATGTNWAIITSSTSSPVLVAATYRGHYPIAPGDILPSIIVTGTVSSDTTSSITCSAIAGVAGDSNPDNNLANNTVFVTLAASARQRQLTKSTLPGIVTPAERITERRRR